MFASTAYEGDRPDSSDIDQSNLQTILEIPKMLPEKIQKEPATGGDSLLRAQRMSLVQLYLPVDIAKESIAAIGSISCFQFRNLNEDKPLNMLLYAGEMQQLDDCERRLTLLAKEAESMGLWQISEISLKEAAAAASSVINGEDAKTASRRSAGLPGTMANPFSPITMLPASLQELYDQLSELEKRILQLKSSEGELRERQRELISRSAVLTEAERLFSEERPHADIDVDSSVHKGSDLLTSAIGAISSDSPNFLGFVGGIIDHSKSAVLQGILWRALRGHLFMRVIDATARIEDVSDDVRGSDLFVVGANGAAALAKVRRLALSQGAIIVSISDSDAEQRAQEAAQAANGLRELEGVLASTAATKRSMLVGLTSALPVWRAFVLKERALFSSLNMCQREDEHERLGGATLAAAGGCLVAEGWAPTSMVGKLHTALERARARTGAPVAGLCSELAAIPLDRHSEESELALTPPTSFVLNKFTGPFQDLINAYGTPTYGEINPALFVLVTFPFLFAVMFGDIGHGFLVLLASGYLILRERKLERAPLIGGDIWSYVFGGRYIIFLMGVWSIYIGFIYNDCFSRCLAIFGTGWEWPTEESPGGPLVVPIQTGVPFFGIDSSWVTAQNSLVFFNAYKTKQAILLGILQMLFGLIISAFNYSFRGDRHSFFGIFLPQFIFLTCTFGYLGILFVAKWVVQTPTSPSLLLMFVDMFLSPGNVDPTRRFYSGQELVQGLLVIVALLCIPWMLLYRPLALHFDAKKAAMKAQKKSPSNKDIPPCNFSPNSVLQHSDVSSPKNTLDTHKDEDTEFSLADELLHSGIHTIEFSLASISNTASYLRLWALSLAHAQLSEVLWDLIVEFAASGPIIGVIVFICWFSLTIAILVAMEGLSAFLHALRLHWIEFNSKFFLGEGKPFEPLSLPAVLSRDAIRRFDPDDGE
ncbi:H(+)-transporting V0 sector ATPase subunit a [Mitosporidium daphniae]|uniref:V-type proton ATPase subunit a n=1 Tax=Mitosporidium daphniae TaxID=1485682 RepID=A0A098VVF7_9MICR|nr:uncharacterized protein DI09_10p250 [Mitosporidium daphniae]KGG53128.1 hypothetical protein DI09_10p250 [Mitosporidium daphniae]|eukprot:XP_013239555.1 uncharacterized protein DI09_10p250 [Mitosporidium daphniae]